MNVLKGEYCWLESVYIREITINWRLAYLNFSIGKAKKISINTFKTVDKAVYYVQWSIML